MLEKKQQLALFCFWQQVFPLWLPFWHTGFCSHSLAPCGLLPPTSPSRKLVLSRLLRAGPRPLALDLVNAPKGCPACVSRAFPINSRPRGWKGEDSRRLHWRGLKVWMGSGIRPGGLRLGVGKGPVVTDANTEPPEVQNLGKLGVLSHQVQRKPSIITKSREEEAGLGRRGPWRARRPVPPLGPPRPALPGEGPRC